MKESLIYKILKYFNDYKAVRNGRIKERVYNRLLGKLFGKAFKWMITDQE